MKLFLLFLVAISFCFAHGHDDDAHAHEHGHSHGHEEEHAHEHVHRHGNAHEHSHGHKHKGEHAHHHHAGRDTHEHSHGEDDHQHSSHSHGHSAHSDQPTVCLLKLDAPSVALTRVLSSSTLQYRVNFVGSGDAARNLEMENLDGLVTVFDSISAALPSCQVILSTLSAEEEAALLPTVASLKSSHVWIAISTALPKPDHSAASRYAAQAGAQFIELLMTGPVSSYGTKESRVIHISGSVHASVGLRDLINSLGLLLVAERDEL